MLPESHILLKQDEGRQKALRTFAAKGYDQKILKNWQHFLGDTLSTLERPTGYIPPTMIGITFEYLALAYLQAHQSPQIQFVETNDIFDYLVGEFNRNNSVDVYPYTGRYSGFAGTGVRDSGEIVQIPDGLILKTEDDKTKISGIFESQIGSNVKPIDIVQNFVHLLRKNPQILGNIPMVDEDEFQFVSLHPSSAYTKTGTRMRRQGWQVFRLPISFTDAMHASFRIMETYVWEQKEAL